MKILTISNLYPPYHHGGYGMLCYRLCEGMTARGHEVSILTSWCFPGENSDSDDLETACTVAPLLTRVEPNPPIGMLLSAIRNHWITKRTIDRFKPDVICTFGIDGLGYDVFHTAASSGVPCVAVLGDTWMGQTWRNLPVFDPWTGLIAGKGSRIKAMVKGCFRWVGKLSGLYCGLSPGVQVPVQVISEFILNDLRAAGGLDENRCRLIPPPLSPPFISASGIPAGRTGERCKTLRVLFLSRMELVKGPDTAIQSLAQAVNQGADITLTMAGIDSDRLQPLLVRLAEGLSVSHRLRWERARTTSELVSLYRSHDVFIFPSRVIEGFGIVCAEAMSCGLPVLGTYPGGQTDVIKDGVNGFLFKPGDDQALGALLVRLSVDRDLLEQLSLRALQEAVKYESTSITEKYENYLFETIETSSSRRP